MGKKLQLPSWVNPDRHLTASKLIPYRNYDHTARWKTNYGIKAHQIIPEREKWETDYTNNIYKINKFDITIGFRIDGKKDNCIFEIKDSQYFKKYPNDCIIQANLYKIALKYNDCKIVTYPTPTSIKSKPNKIIYHNIPQYDYNDLINYLEPFIHHSIKDLSKLDCYK